MRFLLTRALRGAGLVAAVAVLGFLMMEAAPGDFLTDLRSSPGIPTATVEQMQRDSSLDRPVWSRLVSWIRSLLSGDLGVSLIWHRPVADLVWPRACNTALLSLTGLSGAWLVGVPLAALSAARSGSWVSRAASLLVSALVALPDLLVALLVLLTAVSTRWIPVSGSLAGAGFALALIALPAVYRHTYSSMRMAMGEPFVESARAHGLPPVRVWTGHILPAAAGPLISLLGLSFSSLLSASLLVEVVLGWPGLGPLLLEAVAARDQHVVLAGVVLSAGLLAAASLLIDLLLVLCDPRIRRDGL